VSVTLPAHGGSGLDREDRDTVGEDLELVLLVLGIEDLEARDGDDTSNDVVLLLEVRGCLDGDADLRTGGDDGDGGVGGLDSDVGTLQGSLNAGVLKLRQVLTGKGQNAGRVLGGDSGIVGSASLIAVGRTPDHAVGEGTEVSQSLDRLVSRTVLTQTDGVVGSDVDDANAGESRQTDGTGGVGDEVQESTTGRDDGAVGGKAVHDSSHGVLTDTVAEVAAGPVTDVVLRGLEVNGVLPTGVVGASQIGGTREQLGNDAVDLLQDSLGQLTGGNSRVGGLIGGQALLPALGKLAGETTSKIVVLFLVLSSILLEELVPFLLLGSTVGGSLVVEVVDLLGDNEALLGVKAETLLDTLRIIGLEGVAVNTTGTLQLRAETDGGGEADHGGLVLDLTSLLDGGLDALKVVVTVLDPQGVPSVSLEPLGDILSESTLGVTVCSTCFN
jgi:hypothetical protein